MLVNNEDNKDKSKDNVDFDPVKEIKAMRENMVSKETYQKLQKDYANLFEAYKNGDSPDNQEEDKGTVDVSVLRKELFNSNSNMTNLQFCSKALELRDALIANGEEDPFVPNGINIKPTMQDRECAENFANAIKACIEYADGDSQLFTQELQRITTDTYPYPNRK
jgi:hypothetical protein